MLLEIRAQEWSCDAVRDSAHAEPELGTVKINSLVSKLSRRGASSVEI